MLSTVESEPTLEDVLAPSGALLAAQTALGRAIELGAVAASGHDATTLDLLVRLRLAGDAGLRAADLCGQLMLSPSHVSRRIDRAEEQGLVDRSPDPADRRAHRVTLTTLGVAAADDFLPRLTGVLTTVIHDTLTADEVATLIELLQRIEARARDAAC